MRCQARLLIITAPNSGVKRRSVMCGTRPNHWNDAAPEGLEATASIMPLCRPVVTSDTGSATGLNPACCQARSTAGLADPTHSLRRRRSSAVRTGSRAKNFTQPIGAHINGTKPRSSNCALKNGVISSRMLRISSSVRTSIGWAIASTPG